MTDVWTKAEFSAERAFAKTLPVCRAAQTATRTRHQSVLTMARVMLPISRMRAGIDKRVLAIITATA